MPDEILERRIYALTSRTQDGDDPMPMAKLIELFAAAARAHAVSLTFGAFRNGPENYLRVRLEQNTPADAVGNVMQDVSALTGLSLFLAPENTNDTLTIASRQPANDIRKASIIMTHAPAR